ncbi:combover isoform X2 [Ptiloglossa arizonensis]|uniref:combover isoform X2 n=1 Tax=Ptiloglossa arizonensis TaxID=3350558 RepID=UPI003F9EEBC1
MSPGINDGPRNTGTLPKSNRRNDRNREQSAANQFANRSTYHGHAQHSNNLYQLDLKPVSEREHLRITKNSNTRSDPSVPSAPYQDIPEFASYTCGQPSIQPYNYRAEFTYWQKMVPPTDSQTQSPPRFQGTKPSNVDKMPDRSQVESRLNEIRECIRVTSTMMDSLNQSSDPRAQAQNEKLGTMLKDLHDSERKLSRLLEQYQNHGIFCENDETVDENGETSREVKLRKMEELQRKLAHLLKHQANVVGMQLRVSETLNEARQAQQALLQQENQNAVSLSQALPVNVEQLESETAKLAQLQTKKKHMDHLVAELQAIEMSDRGSCSSEGSRNVGRDKVAELKAIKLQHAYLEALLKQITRARDGPDSDSDSEPEVDINGDTVATVDACDEESGTNISFERQSDPDEISHEKIRNTTDRLTVEEIEAVTQELREQTALLQITKAEIQRLKAPLASTSTTHSNSTSVFPTSTPPPSLTTSTASDKKQDNNTSLKAQPIQGKRRQIEDLVRKDSSQSSSINRDVGGPTDVNSHRSSSSHISYTSTPANVWPPSAAIGPQTTAIENGFNGNWWTYPPPPLNQLQQGSSEYYRQLLLGSQAQQLQMMGTTLQQCCQLLWSQQRELQAMRAAVTQLQVQLRQNQLQQRSNNCENNDEYSNLSRNVHHLGETLDSTLPPSSSLPNLVSLPNSSPALSHNAGGTSANSQQQQQQQQQLNNQVPPGNRANNYWDNFRSYSRQNLLSGSVKTMTDATSGAIANSTSSGNAISSVNSSLMKDKRNREQGADNIPLPSLSGAETQYSLNLQLQSNLQQQERENAVTRSNILSNEVSQPQVDNLSEEAHASFRLPSVINDEYLLQTLSSEVKEVLSSLISVNKKQPDYLVTVLLEIKAISEDHRLRPRLLRALRALQDMQPLSNPLNETTDQTASESCQSSDEDSEVDAVLGTGTENQSSITELIESQAGSSSSPTAHVPFIDFEIPGIHYNRFERDLPPTSLIKPGYNEDLAEADQSRPESSGNQQSLNNEEENEQGQEEAAGPVVSTQGAFDGELDTDQFNKT